ncbi:MAG: ATP-grasp domain-containing protein [Pyrinomonadaceae bacterium]|nr:ATP-grasp domain-containing protein [Pyrinomonadaceae bacterium]
MPQSETAPLNIICLATYFKGVDFIRECKRLGAHVVLITKEKMLKEDWPRDSLDDLIALPNDAGPPLFIDLVSFLAQRSKPDRIVALEEFDVMTAALVREHFCLPGMSSSIAKTFRDKMAMAINAKAAGLNVPDFVPLINTEEVEQFMKRVPPPWIIKPRSDVSAIGISKVEKPEEVWRVIEERNARENLRERVSYYLLAQFIPGEVFHVDSIVDEGRVRFVGANRYGRPPLEVAKQGGAYVSRTVAHTSANEKELLAINRKLIKALKLERGAAHAEFIKSDTDGRFYFLEIAARVGGAYIADVLEAATGVNLWREWARMEATDDRSSRQRQTAAQKPDRQGGPGTSRQGQTEGADDPPVRRGGLGSRKLKQPRNEYAGIVLSLSKQEAPDTSAYDDPEIVYRVKKRHHAGLIVRSSKLERVEELLTQYAGRFADDFIAVVPPLEKAE